MSRVSQDLPEGGGARVRSTADDLPKIRDRVWRNFVSAYTAGGPGARKGPGAGAASVRARL